MKLELETLKHDPYSNYLMLHPDGTPMNRTSARKAEWYVSRGLATWIDDKTYKLTFVPNGMGRHNDEYYLQESKNICVVCGNEHHLTKHHVVPYMFRKLFPEYCKHDHYDILIVCNKDHDLYETHADNLKAQILRPYINKDIVSYNTKIEQAKITLSRIDEHPMIPLDRLAFLKEWASKEPMDNDGWQSSFILTYDTEEKIYNFFRMWREHFVKYTNPQHLPNNWKTDHPLEKN